MKGNQMPDKKTSTEIEMFLLANKSRREVLDNSECIHDFQGRADQFLEAVRRVVESVHHFHERNNAA